MNLWQLPILDQSLKSSSSYFESESESCLVVSYSLLPHDLYSPWNSPGQNTGVGSYSLLQGIIPAQGLNTGLPYCRRILYHLSHQEGPRILEWVAVPFSSRSSRPRNLTKVSCVVGRFFTSWATREAPSYFSNNNIYNGTHLLSTPCVSGIAPSPFSASSHFILTTLQPWLKARKSPAQILAQIC